MKTALLLMGVLFGSILVAVGIAFLRVRLGLPPSAPQKKNTVDFKVMDPPGSM